MTVQTPSQNSFAGGCRGFASFVRSAGYDHSTDGEMVAIKFQAAAEEIDRLTARATALESENAAFKADSETYVSMATDDAMEIERLREALAFYANPDVYRPHPHGLAFDDRDLSFRARVALGDAP